MIAAGINHFVNPKFYHPFIPAMFPKLIANLLSGAIEIIIGVLLFIPEYRKLGGLGFFLLMIAFLPLHIWDLMKVKPAIGSKKIAVVRLFLQFLLIYYGWYIWKGQESIELAIFSIHSIPL